MTLVTGTISGCLENLYYADSLISGNLVLTGSQLISYTNAVSGMLNTQISANAAGVSTLNGLSGALNVIGTGTIFVSTGAGRIIISGDTSIIGALTSSGVQLSNTIFNTGSVAYGLITGMSGQDVLNYATITNLGTTGHNLYNLVTGASGQANTNYATIVNLGTTGQGLYTIITGFSGQGNTNFATIGNLTQTGVQLQSIIASSGSQAWNAANGNGVNLSGALTQTGAALIARDAATSGALDSRLTITGVQLQSIITSTGLVIGQISGAIATQLTLTGAALTAIKITGSSVVNAANFTGVGTVSIINSGGIIYVSGAASAATNNSDGINISGNLTQTGVQLYNTITGMSGVTNTTLNSLSGYVNAVSGGLQSQIVGAVGSQVRVTGSASVNIADFTGIGGTLVFSSGTQVFISGAAPGAGGGVPSVNSITSAVTIIGTGNLAAVTIGNQIVISGSNIVTDKQILFDTNGITSGTDNLAWDNGSGTLRVGQPQLFYSGNPLSLAGSGSVIQMTARNRSNLSNSTTDIALTNDVGSDFSGYINLGINSSTYNQAAYNVGTGRDGYLFIEGGNLDIGTLNPNKIIQFVTAGATSGNVRATIDSSGINLASGMTLRVNNVPISTQPMAITFNTASASYTNQPAATNFFIGSALYVTYADLGGFTGVNLVVSKGTTASAATGAMWLGMRGDPNQTATNYVPLTANAARILTNVASTVITSGYQPLAAGSQTGVYIALLVSGGSAAVTPVFGNITAYFK